MDARIKEIIWNQYGAAIDTLDDVIVTCPESLWSDSKQEWPFWALTFHVLFWLDFYLEGKKEGFHPPAPFGLEELDPAGVLPPRVYTKEELRGYLAYCREKCRNLFANLTDEQAERPYKLRAGEVSWLELALYNMRHVQHHAAQLNMWMRREAGTAAGWVGRARTPLAGPG